MITLGNWIVWQHFSYNPCVRILCNCHWFIAFKESNHTWLKTIQQHLRRPCHPGCISHYGDGLYWLHLSPDRWRSQVRVYKISTPPLLAGQVNLCVPWRRYFTHDPRRSSLPQSSSQTSIFRPRCVSTFIKNVLKLNQNNIKTYYMLCWPNIHERQLSTCSMSYTDYEFAVMVVFHS